jgi:phage terminase small subunit
MTPKQQRFVDEYVKDPDRNQTQAARKAGYSEKTAAQAAAHLLKNPNIQLAIREKLELVRAETALKIQREEEENWLDPVNVAKGFKKIYDRCMQAEAVMRYDAREKRMVPVRDEHGNAMYVFDSNGANRAWENIAKHIGFYEIDNAQKAPIINIELNNTNNIAILNASDEEAGDKDQFIDGNVLTMLPPSSEE